MKSLITRIWNTSPASLMRAFVRRWYVLTEKPSWHIIKAGPLKGVKFYVPGRLNAAWKEMAEGTYDSFFYEELRGRELENRVCWDLGAHIGYHSLGFAAMGACVLAFEPNEANRKVLQIQVEANPKLASRIRWVPFAAADFDGEMAFVETSNVASCESSGSCLDPEMNLLDENSDFHRTKVPVARVDTLIEQGEAAPEILKIDVEGAEMLVLNGARNLFVKHRPFVLMEVHHIRLAFQVQDFFNQYGYSLRFLNDKGSSASRCFIVAAPKERDPKSPSLASP